MIVISDVNKVYHTRGGARTVLKNINLTVEPGEKLGVLGRNGAGKSTLIRVISGAELPTTGKVRRTMSISWPLAFSGAFQGSLSGIDNLRFVCRIYGIPVAPVIPFVEEFSELGIYLKEPVKKYSSGMRARLAFAISMAVNFDCFLIDEIVAVGDTRFHEKCHTELFENRKDKAMVIVSHDPTYIRAHCDRAAVLVNGCLQEFSDIEAAYNFYHQSA